MDNELEQANVRVVLSIEDNSAIGGAQTMKDINKLAVPNFNGEKVSLSQVNDVLRDMYDANKKLVSVVEPSVFKRINDALEGVNYILGQIVNGGAMEIFEEDEEEEEGPDIFSGRCDFDCSGSCPSCEMGLGIDEPEEYKPMTSEDLLNSLTEYNALLKRKEELIADLEYCEHAKAKGWAFANEIVDKIRELIAEIDDKIFKLINE